jgi:phosphatidylinositol 4-kinase
LGGSNSKYFNEFRKLFSQGYIAARKHQDKIVTLVKLMYSSHGQTMPCF